MKRGLVVLDPQEISKDELAARVSRLQQVLRQQGMAAALIYADVYRSGDITYLTNLCIYWNEGVLIVPANAEPALLTKLSSRVHPWMRSISTLQDLRSGSNIADMIGQYFEKVSPSVVGMVGLSWWPAPLVDELQAKLSGWQLRDLGSIVEQERKHPSERERSLLRASAKICASAVAVGLDHSLSNSERAGKAELLARMAGVEDVLVLCRQAADQADTVEVRSEYRGYWTVAARVVLNGSPDWAPTMLRAYEAAKRQLMAGVGKAQLQKTVGEILVDSKIPWRIDLIHHTDLETGGDYRMPGEALNPVPGEAVVGMRLEYSFVDGTQAAVADTFEINGAGATCLTGGLPEVFFQS